MTRFPHTIVEWLRAGYPEGVPHTDHFPLPALLSLDRPIGLTVSAHGLTFERAVRLGFDGHEAWPDADGRHYGLATPRGTGRFEIQGLPALTLQA